MASPLAEAHIEAQRRLRQVVTQAIGASWRSLPSYDRKDVPLWLARAVPVVTAGQRQSVHLTDAYLARALKRAPVGVDPDSVIARLRPGVTPEEQWERPFVTVWTALAGGTPFVDAVASGLARANGMAAMDVQMASRGTFSEAQGKSAIRGWQRIANGGACAYCSEIDGAFVKSADASPLHPGCGCSLEPILEDVQATPLPETVAVHTHGELGSVIGSPDHDFTGPAAVT